MKQNPANFINLADLQRALPSRPPFTAADKLRTEMLAGPAGKTPPIHKEGRAKTGSVSCFKCGHTHSVGSQCAYDKALKSFLDKYDYLEKGSGNTTGNRGHNTNHDKTGKWTSSDKAVVVSGPSRASEKKNPRSGHQKTEVTEKPPGQTTGQSIPASDVSPVAPTVASSSPSASNPPTSKKEVDPEVSRNMFAVKLGTEHAKRMEAEGGSRMSYPWLHNNPVSGISPEHHKEAQGAAQNMYDRSKRFIQDTGASDNKAHAYANAQAHDAYVSHLADKYAGEKQFLPSDMQQTNAGMRPPQNMDVSQARTAGGPAPAPAVAPELPQQVSAAQTQPESAIPTRNIISPVQSSAPPTGQTAPSLPQPGPSPQTKPGAVPAPLASPPGQAPKSPSSATATGTPTSSSSGRGGQSTPNTLSRVAQSIIPTQQAYAMGAGLVQPGQGFRAASSAAAQPVHSLLRPSTQKQPSERDQYQKDRIEDTKFDNSQKQQHMNRLKQWYSNRAA